MSSLQRKNLRAVFSGSVPKSQDNLIANEKGESRISMEDYAIAMVDELEKHAHSRRRFSVGN